MKEISSDERLERETQLGPATKPLSPEELTKLACDQLGGARAEARAEGKPEADRLRAYMQLYAELSTRTAAFDLAMARNPDLAYQEGSQALALARETCVKEAADVRVEFERFVRELVEVPTVQEIKGGGAVTVARIDFGTLREAIEALRPNDQEQLLLKVQNAEKKVEPKRRK